MRVLTLQSSNLHVSGRTFPDAGLCNYAHALPVYHRLFEDYNAKKGTCYDSFFWAFSNLRRDTFEGSVKRACEMLGKDLSKESLETIYVLDVPDELCLETDFYNFADEIFAHQFPDSLESIWHSIYEKRNAERQVIFPYIDEDMIVLSLPMPEFLSTLEGSA